jgi:hypothetical protein
MFIMSWSVLWMGVQAAWTPWGLVSGFLWVIGGTGGIYGIRMAGLAIAVGTWASVMILVNFVWGILIFREPVRNIWSTLGAFLLLGCGLVGMSHYSAPQNKQQHQHQQQLDDNDINDTVHSMENKNNSNKSTTYGSGLDNNNTNDPERSLIPPSQEQQQGTHFSLVDGKKNDQPDTTLVGGHIVNKRAAGIAGAVFNGLMTGSSLIPLHYAEQEGFGGARYMISFASGALISNIMIWFVWWAVCFADTYQRDVAGSKLRQTADNMPQWHFYQLWLPAGIAGILLSIAMFGSILSVTYLGQGVGNSLVQSKILVSGLWGIFWYQGMFLTLTMIQNGCEEPVIYITSSQLVCLSSTCFAEIRGRRTIVSWFIAASRTYCGVFFL